MLPSTTIELVVLIIALQVGGIHARRAFTGFDSTGIDDNAQLVQRDARRPFTLPDGFEPNQHRKPFTAPPPLITGRPVIENEIPVERPVIQDYLDDICTVATMRSFPVLNPSVSTRRALDLRLATCAHFVNAKCQTNMDWQRNQVTATSHESSRGMTSASGRNMATTPSGGCFKLPVQQRRHESDVSTNSGHKLSDGITDRMKKASKPQCKLKSIDSSHRQRLFSRRVQPWVYMRRPRNLLSCSAT